MRQRSGCKACRERHIKCVKVVNSTKCKYCSEKKKQCIRGNAFRFRPVKAVKFNAGEDIGSAEQSLKFCAGQTWVNIPSTVHFLAPNTEGDEEGSDIEEDNEENPVVDQADSAHSASSSTEKGPGDVDAIVSDEPSSYADPSLAVFDVSTDLPSIHEALGQHVSPPIATRSDSYNARQHKETTIDLGAAASNWHVSPIVHHVPPSPHVLGRSPLGSHNNNHVSPYTSSAFSPSSTLHLKWPVNGPYEARLFHHYIVHCTNWIDTTDARRHFEKEVPKRAAHFPVILNGILGLAARHLWLMGRVEEDWSQLYVDQCLQALIVALEDPLAHWDENFLVAVILMRLHEEMGEADDLYHHFGTARTLNSISSFAADGGLREAASLVSLRQHIYVSLTTQQPLNLSLDNFRQSSIFREFDDESWTNRIIFLFATILQAVFEDTSNGISREKWKDLDNEVEEWHRNKPWSFSPFHMEPDAGEKFTGSWPELPCAQGVVAVGLQYYHLCKIILTLYSPDASLVGLAGVRARKATDAVIRKHIRITIGYGVSNSHCGNAMFQGCHILSVCGAYMVDEKEQEACVEYLVGLQKLIGWRTDKVLKDLREQWAT
ncbi:hypothetical protein T440DRAFT_416190 [Plenodomus tracheiphilus IPT5]|uniref:Zn(2)-C6 fungal-type domain-containing protein n=1 Tax=Plenodomus tracheiphilus IPT5 TaxID=1408161 RepID=A0A6A7BH14_9PLEO|nr:hypothetical protein T440DRAFT_416190 [Plenodomus tracheiphilus IPT5]